MDPITQQLLLGAAGAAGGDPVYVDDVFSTFVYKGNNSTNTITNGIDLSGEGGLVWLKNRVDTGGSDNLLFDTERGVAVEISTNQGRANRSTGTDYGVQSFNSNGFTFKGNWVGENASGDPCVSWTFRKAPGFFDVVTFTGNGATSGSPLTVNHDLGSAPGMIWVKNLTTASTNWFVYHRSLGVNKFMILNLTNSVFNYNGGFANITSSSFQVYDSNATNGNSFVAYVFAHDEASFGTNGDESIIKCDSYTDSTQPYEVNVGFEPQWVMIKNTGSSSAYAPWIMFDNMRGVYAGDTNASNYGHDPALSANYGHPEGSTYNYNANFIDFTPTGFKVFQSNTPVATSGGNFIYMAIRRPNKPPELATEVFGLSTQSGSPYPTFTSGFPVDFFINRNGMSNAGNDNYIGSRLTGKEILKSNTMGERVAYGDIGWDYMTGFGEENNTVSDNYAYMFKRAPGFMDVVNYVGNGSVRTLNHNLGVIPELIITKSRSNTQQWGVSSSLFPNPTGDFLYLQASDEIDNFSNNLFKTATNTTYGYGTASPNDGRYNRSYYTYVSYLFATLSGISKVSTYSGTGNAINVDCGFTNGARFILIKRTNGSGKWYVWDTLRGISSGNDSYFTLNQDAAQVTNTDFIDPLSAGFTVTSSAPAALNTSGGTYLFLAIA